MHGAAFTAAEAEAKREAAQHVLGWAGEERGLQPGRFTTTLLDAWSVADKDNRRRLSLGFPYLAAAFDTWNHHGPEALREWGGLDA